MHSHGQCHPLANCGIAIAALVEWYPSGVVRILPIRLYFSPANHADFTPMLHRTR